MYYILKNDGTTLFEHPYCLEFCLHCLFHLIDTQDPNLQNCRLLHFEVPASCLSSERGINSVAVYAAKVTLQALSEHTNP